MDLSVVQVEKPETINFVFGQSHFIKTVEDIHEALVSTVPGIKFGIAFLKRLENVWYDGQVLMMR